MTNKQLARLIEYLEAVRQRPSMYVGTVNVEQMVHFLTGFRGAILVLGEFSGDLDVREQVLTDRAWQFCAISPHHEMVKRGLTPQQVIDELVGIEIEILRRLGRKESRNA